MQLTGIDVFLDAKEFQETIEEEGRGWNKYFHILNLDFFVLGVPVFRVTSVKPSCMNR